MYATDALGDALEATREFLLPVDLRHWGKLAFVTFFLGGIGAGFSGPPTPSADVEAAPGEPIVPGEPILPGEPVVPPAVPGDIWLIAAAVVVLAVALSLAFHAVRGIMDFVLIESLREEQVEIQRFAGARWRQGLRLFGFRLVVDLLAFLLVAMPLVLVFGPLLLGVGRIEFLLVGFLLLVPVLLVVPAGAALLNGFTTAFVVPTMILHGGGVLDGWRRFWPTLRREWKEYVAYAVVNLVLVIAGGIALGIGATLAGILVLVPFLLLFGGGFALFQISATAGVGVLVLAGLLYAAVVAVAVALLKAPILTYVRYYALFVLGDTDADLDPIPERRRLVRAERD